MTSSDNEIIRLLGDPPKSLHQIDEQTVSLIDAWILKFHPDACITNLRSLLQIRNPFTYSTTILKLVSHNIIEHDLDCLTLAKCFHTIIYFDIEKSDIGQSIMKEQKRLVSELLENWDELNDSGDGVNCIYYIGTSIDVEVFSKLWDSIWGSDAAERCKSLSSSLFLVSAFSSTKKNKAIELVAGPLDRVYSVIPEVLIEALMHSPEMTDISERVLLDLIERYGLPVARQILKSSADCITLSNAIRAAIRLLLSKAPDDSLIPIGIGWRLDYEWDAAVQQIREWIKDAKNHNLDDSFLKSRIENSDKKKLADSILLDVIKRKCGVQQYYAYILCDFISDKDVLIELIYAHIKDESVSVFSAMVVALYLSQEYGSLTSDQKKKLIDASKQLHANFGKLSEKIIRKNRSLTDENLPDYDIHFATALARDVARESSVIDPQIVLQQIKQYPNTYKALGGHSFDNFIDKGGLPPFAYYYSMNILDPSIDAISIRRIITFRNKWEKWFLRIIAANIGLPTRRLREDYFVWAEMRILSFLLDSFTVRYEPSNITGMGRKLPDFLIESNLGRAIIEVVTIGVQPDEVMEGVRGLPPARSKYPIMEKWKEKFNKCKTDTKMPVIIAVQLKRPFDLEFDLKNSLYGPDRLRLTVDTKTGKVISKVNTRESTKGFFFMEDVDCISAVIGILPDEDDSGCLMGEIFLPVKKPRNPIPPPFYVRLRDTLFQSSISRLINRMKEIPTIIDNEAKELVLHGIDESSLFAFGIMEYPEGIQIPRERFDQLMKEAIKMISDNQ